VGVFVCVGGCVGCVCGVCVGGCACVGGVWGCVCVWVRMCE